MRTHNQKEITFPLTSSPELEYKILVLNKEAGREIQQLFFQLGYSWISSGKEYQSVENGYIYTKDGYLYFSFVFITYNLLISSYVHLTIPELRDIVFIHRNTESDATHEDQDEEKWLKLSDGTWYKWEDTPYYGRPRWLEHPCEDLKLIRKLISEKEIESLKLEILQLKSDLLKYKNNDWISVEDRLPENGQDVFAVNEIVSCQFVNNEFLEGYYEYDTGYSYQEAVEVTHWKPILRASKKEVNNE